MIADLMDILFGCWHSNFSFPLASKDVPAAMQTGHYVCCLECGKEFPYDWKTMRVIGKSPKQEHYADSYTGTLLDELTEQVEGITK